jgi:sodium-coupled neutral amino acid transporter 11
MFIMAYGAMLSYLMIVKDSFSALLGVDPDDTAQRRAVLFLVSMLVMVPLASKRDMADLSFTSRLSVLIDSVLVIMVVMNAPVGESLEQEGGWEGMWTHAVHFDTLFVGLGVLSFAFVCQHSAFIIAGSLENPTIARWSIASRSALALCGILALTCGVAGYTGYLEETQGNILQNLDPTSWTANAARGMLGTTMLFVYPLESFVARHVCVVLFFQGRRAHEGEDSTVLNRRDRRIGLTVALYLIAVIPASIFEDLGFVLALSGAIGGSCLSYIGPGVVFLGVHGERFLKLVSDSWLGKMLPSSEASSGNATAKKVHSTEATPLVATTTGDAEAGTPEDEKLSTNAGEEQPASTLAAALRPIVWYLTAMPCWCAVARFGTSGIQTHAEDMALKSPHPIRIGSVEYRRRETKMGDDIDERPTIVRIDSMPMMPKGRLVNTGKPPKSPGNINQMLGKEILKRQQEAMKQPKEGFEHDPQELPPTWYDFIVAIFFILFGCLALVAGLGSLMHGK